MQDALPEVEISTLHGPFYEFQTIMVLDHCIDFIPRILLEL